MFGRHSVKFIRGRAIFLPAAEGRIGIFGGPDDREIAPDETDWLENAKLRDLVGFYIAMRWPIGETAEALLISKREAKIWWSRQRILVIRPDLVRACVCRVADWGPAVETGRKADISPAAAEFLGVDTDDRLLFRFAPDSAPEGPFTE